MLWLVSLEALVGLVVADGGFHAGQTLMKIHGNAQLLIHAMNFSHDLMPQAVYLVIQAIHPSIQSADLAVQYFDVALDFLQFWYDQLLNNGADIHRGASLHLMLSLLLGGLGLLGVSQARIITPSVPSPDRAVKGAPAAPASATPRGAGAPKPGAGPQPPATPTGQRAPQGERKPTDNGT